MTVIIYHTFLTPSRNSRRVKSGSNAARITSASCMKLITVSIKLPVSICGMSIRSTWRSLKGALSQYLRLATWEWAAMNFRFANLCAFWNGEHLWLDRCENSAFDTACNVLRVKSLPWVGDVRSSRSCPQLLISILLEFGTMRFKINVDVARSSGRVSRVRSPP